MKLRFPAWTTRALAAAVLTAGIAGPASAAQIATSWNYFFRAGWDKFTPQASGSQPFAVTGDTTTPWSNAFTEDRTRFLDTRLRWGQTSAGSNTVDPNAQSQLVILARQQSGPGGGNPNLITNGPLLHTFDVEHRNFPIFSFNQALRSTDFITNVTLQPNAPPGDAFTAPTLTFDVNFKETQNFNAPCPSSSSPDASGCPDIFVLGNLNNLQRTLPGALFGPQFAGINYLATISIQGLQALPDAACAAAGASAGCQGFITLENRVNTFGTFFSIRAIPEPSSLALAGLVLLGLGGLSMRRKP
jgi:hypothetical protein